MKLKWERNTGLSTTDGRWHCQREHSRGEPPCYYVERGPIGWREAADDLGLSLNVFSDQGGVREFRRRVQLVNDRLGLTHQGEQGLPLSGEG